MIVKMLYRTLLLLSILQAVSLNAQVLFGNSYSNDGNVVKYEEQGFFYSLTVRASGKTELSEDDRSIAAIEPNGFVHIRHRNGLTTRDLVIKAGSGGGLTYEYRIQGLSYEFDDEGRGWLAMLLPEVVEKTGLGAEGRVARILGQGGLSAVLRELKFAGTNHARMVYFLAIINDERCTPELFEDALQVAAAQISSSSRLADVLKKAAVKFPDNPKISASLYHAIREMSSSSASAASIEELTEIRPPSKEGQLTALEVIRQISSSSAQAAALEAISKRIVHDPDVYTAYCTSVQSISSSSSQGVSLSRLLEVIPQEKAFVWNELFETVEQISSSSVQGQVLENAASRCPTDAQTVASFLRAVEHISSSSVQGACIQKLLERDGLSQEELRMINDFAEDHISSSSVQRAIQSTILNRKLRP